MRLSELVGGTWALVTGASSGLGTEFARQLGAAGANLVLTARREPLLQALAAEIRRAHGVEVRVIALDLSQPDGAKALGDAVEALGVPIDLLVNNAGSTLVGRFVGAGPEAAVQMLRLLCEAPTVLSRRFLPAMTARGRGGIINVSSLAAYYATPYMAMYGAAKAYLRSLSLALAEEARPHGVRVTALCPGPVRTGFHEASGMEPPTGLVALATTDPAANVRAALQGYTAGRTIVMIGGLNRAVSAAAGFVPVGLAARLAEVLLRHVGRAK